MADHLNFREQSRNIQWGSRGTEMTIEQINCGSLLRIADATEKMSANYLAMHRDLEMYKRWYEQEQKVSQRMAKRIAALKGVITKLKNNAAGSKG